MKIVLRILLVILVLLIIGPVAVLGVTKFWSRPGRLSQAESTALLKQAWDVSQREIPVGEREIFYDLGGEVIRINTKDIGKDKAEVFRRLMNSLFPQIAPSDDFLGQVNINHNGRIRIAGITCEKILVSPKDYDGNAIEVWIEPVKNHVLGYETLDFEGNLVRGFRFLTVTGAEPVPDSGAPRLQVFDRLIPGEIELIPPDGILPIAERHEIALPEWLPAGFKLVGGRYLMNFDQPAIGGDFLPGMGIGQLPDIGPGGGGPGGGRFGQGQFRDQGGHFQTVYSDGLNTITIVQLPPGRLGEGLREPSRAEGILSAKADEVWRLFHTGMAGVFLPNAVILVFGEVSPDVARQVADSIPVEPIFIPEPPNPDSQFPPGFGGPPPDRPFGGMGFGRRGNGGAEENPPSDQGTE